PSNFLQTHFTKMNADKCNFDESEMMKMLWDDNCYDTETREWTQKTPELLLANVDLFLPLRLYLKIFRLPSPHSAQRYRFENLYGGPSDTYTNAIKECDPNGPLILYVSKMFPDASDKGRFFAFGRLFAGKISSVAMADLDLIITKSATLTNETEVDTHPIRAVRFSVSPVVLIVVSCADSDLRELLEGLKRLSRSDPTVVCTIEEKRQYMSFSLKSWLLDGSRDEEFAWDDNSLGKKILYFTRPNMVVNIGKGDWYLDSIKESIVVGFQFTSKKCGVLARENMRGISFQVCDVFLKNRDRVTDILDASTNAIYASQLTAKPRLLEPVYLVEIQSRESYLAKIHREPNNRCGNVFEEMTREGTPLYKIKAWLPVVESFGFFGYLQGSTNDDVFPQCVFHHWVMMSSDPLIP
nr:elongation factor 2 [Tanacetum cinerariifolium]